MAAELSQTVAELSNEQRRNMNWLISLVRGANQCHIQDNEVARSLQRSLQVYTAYVTTGDSRYLSLCEDYLQAGLTTP